MITNIQQLFHHPIHPDPLDDNVAKAEILIQLTQSKMFVESLVVRLALRHAFNLFGDRINMSLCVAKPSPARRLVSEAMRPYENLRIDASRAEVFVRDAVPEYISAMEYFPKPNDERLELFERWARLAQHLSKDYVEYFPDSNGSCYDRALDYPEAFCELLDCKKAFAAISPDEASKPIWRHCGFVDLPGNEIDHFVTSAFRFAAELNREKTSWFTKQIAERPIFESLDQDNGPKLHKVEKKNGRPKGSSNEREDQRAIRLISIYNREFRPDRQRFCEQHGLMIPDFEKLRIRFDRLQKDDAD